MWPRVCEIVLGAWLLASLFVFDAPRAEAWNRAVCGVLIIALAAASWSWRFRRAYLGNIALAIWLGAFAWVRAGHPAPAALQSDLVTALVLICFAILPNEAAKPPRSWRKLLPGM